MRKVALLTVLAFGCTTIRVPVSSLGGDLGEIRGMVAEPQLELWIESADPVTADEAAKAQSAARTALAGALEGRGVPEASADAVLLVREQAVARTDSRRSSQGWAIAGVVGAVVVVAAVVIAIVTGSKGSPPHPAKPATAARGAAPKATAPARGAAPATRSAPPRTRPVQPAPRRDAVTAAPAPPWVAPRRVPAPAPARPPWQYGGPYYGPYDGGYGGFDVAIGLELVFPIPPPAPLVLAPPAYPEYPEPPDAAAIAPGSRTVDDEEAPGDEPAPPPPFVLPPPQPFDVEQRGFFAGDVVQLELVLLDRRNGRTLWSKTVRRDVDPRDARKVAEMVEEALADQAWAQRPRAGR